MNGHTIGKRHGCSLERALSTRIRRRRCHDVHEVVSTGEFPRQVAELELHPTQPGEKPVGDEDDLQLGSPRGRAASARSKRVQA